MHCWPLLFVLIALVLAAACSNSGPERTDAWKQAELASRYARFRKSHPEGQDISARDALSLLRRQTAIFVDDREPYERAVSMLPDAVGASEFLADPEMAQGRTVVVYCSNGERGVDLVARLAGQGVPAVNLAGGVLAWTHVHGPLVNPLGAPTDRVHVHSRKWNLADSKYEPVW
ncbi:rhodanese-like domain-containing protein [Fundidesulfovibrio butyratiphilus]